MASLRPWITARACAAGDGVVYAATLTARRWLTSTKPTSKMAVTISRRVMEVLAMVQGSDPTGVKLSLMGPVDLSNVRCRGGTDRSSASLASGSPLN